MIDLVHGVAVHDPYRWLEQLDDPDVVAFVAAQNARTREALDPLTDRPAWHERLCALLQVPISAGCRTAGGQVFTLERAGGQPQFTLCVQGLDGGDVMRLLVDPVGEAVDGASALDWFEPSLDGSLVAYGISEGGNERSTLRVISVADGRVLADEIPDARAASVAWAADGARFLYTRYPAGDEYNRRVYEHVLGAAWPDDRLVWDALATPQSWAGVDRSSDDRYTLVTEMITWSHNELHLHDAEMGTWVTLVDGGIDATTRARFEGHQLLAVTTLDSPLGRVVLIDPASPTSENWRTLVPERDGPTELARFVGDELVTVGLRSAVAVMHRYTLDGVLIGEVDLGEPCSIEGFDVEGDEVVMDLVSFTQPSYLARWSPGAGVVAASTRALPFDPGALAVRFTTYPSLDGTEIGLFLVHRADQLPTADTPTILTGYGGFALAESPGYGAGMVAWCEAGGLYAIAGLRGGSEHGEAWHHAGRRANKQSVFDDFHAAADHLVSSGLASRDRLVVRGGSNGGLLMGVAITQRPGLAKAVVCQVPLLDMVRFPLFLIARLWTSEYGDPDVADEFAWLWDYSPYHHVRDGARYPSVLLTTATGEGRVHPSHALKMAAALQAATVDEPSRPVLLRVEDRAGHGVGKPLAKQADELADILAYCSWQLSGPRPLGS